MQVQQGEGLQVQQGEGLQVQQGEGLQIQQGEGLQIQQGEGKRGDKRSDKERAKGTPPSCRVSLRSVVIIAAKEDHSQSGHCQKKHHGPDQHATHNHRGERALHLAADPR